MMESKFDQTQFAGAPGLIASRPAPGSREAADCEELRRAVAGLSARLATRLVEILLPKPGSPEALECDRLRRYGRDLAAPVAAQASTAPNLEPETELQP